MKNLHFIRKTIRSEHWNAIKQMINDGYTWAHYDTSGVKHLCKVEYYTEGGLQINGDPRVRLRYKALYKPLKDYDLCTKTINGRIWDILRIGYDRYLRKKNRENHLLDVLNKSKGR